LKGFLLQFGRIFLLFNLFCSVVFSKCAIAVISNKWNIINQFFFRMLLYLKPVNRHQMILLGLRGRIFLCFVSGRWRNLLSFKNCINLCSIFSAGQFLFLIGIRRFLCCWFDTVNWWVLACCVIILGRVYYWWLIVERIVSLNFRYNWSWLFHFGFLRLFLFCLHQIFSIFLAFTSFLNQLLLLILEFNNLLLSFDLFFRFFLLVDTH